MKGYAIVNYNYSNEELFNDDLGVFWCSDMMTYPIFSVGVFTNFEEAVNEATCLAEDIFDPLAGIAFAVMRKVYGKEYRKIEKYAKEVSDNGAHE